MPKKTLTLRVVLIVLVARYAVAQAAPEKTVVERRVESILSRMTTDEKIEMIGERNDPITGIFDATIPAIPIPANSPASVGVGCICVGVPQSPGEFLK